MFYKTKHFVLTSNRLLLWFRHWSRLFKVVPDTDFSQLTVSVNSPIFLIIQSQALYTY